MASPETVNLTITMEVAPEAVDLSPASGGTLITSSAHDTILETLMQFGENIEIEGTVT